MPISSILGQQNKEATLLDSLEKTDDKTLVYNELAALFLATDSLKVKTYATQALVLSQVTNNHLQEAIAYHHLGETAYYFYQYAPAIGYYKKAAAIFNFVQKDEAEAQAYSNIGLCFDYLSHYDSAIYYHQKVLLFEPILKDKPLIGKAYNNIGLCYQFQNRPEKSIPFFKKAIGFNQSIDRKTTHPHTNLVRDYLYLLQYDSALFYLNQALELDLTTQDSIGLVAHYRQIADLYYQQSNISSAKNTLKKSIAIAKQQANKDALTRNYLLYGDILMSTQHYDSASVYFQNALIYAQQLNNPRLVAYTQMDIGTYYVTLKTWNKAETYLQKALTFFESNTQKPFGLIDNLNRLADCFYQQNEYPQALRYTQQALELLKEYPHLESRIWTLKIQAQTFEQQKKYRLATDSYRQYAQLKDSLLTKENKEINLQLLQEIENKEQEIILAQQQISLLEKDRQLATVYQASAIIFIVLLLLLLLFLYDRFRQQKKFTQTLQNIEKQINKKESNEKIEAFFNTKTQQYLGKISTGINQLKTYKISSKEATLQQLVEELKSYNYMVSHDLRQPIQRIKNIVYLLEEVKKENLSLETRTYLNNINTSVIEMEKMIEVMLSLSQLDDHALYFSDFSMRQFLEEIASHFKIALDEKSINFYIHKMPSIYTDRELWKRVFFNLIENAIKFSDDAKKPYIEVGHQLEEKKHLFWIKDNGIGLQASELNNIFNPFYQVRSSIGNEGLGIGLAIVKKAVERLNGQIWVESRPKEGTTFFIRL